MTREEAFVYLNITDPEELEDGYEAALFEIKQFLLSRPVFLKTVEGKLTRLERLREAFLFLGGTEPGNPDDTSFSFAPQEQLSEHFSAYYREKNRLRQLLSATLHAQTIRNSALQLIALERIFAEPFAAFPDWTAAEVTVGKEPDVMEVTALLREQAEQGRATLQALSENKNKLPQNLLLVLKRLSLLKNYLY